MRALWAVVRIGAIAEAPANAWPNRGGGVVDAVGAATVAAGGEGLRTQAVARRTAIGDSFIHDATIGVAGVLRYRVPGPHQQAGVVVQAAHSLCTAFGPSAEVPSPKCQV